MNKQRPNFIIDSEFRQPGSSSKSHFQYKLMTEINSNFSHMSIISAYIPKMWYVVQEGYDKFILTELATTVNLIIPSGNYSVSTLMAALDTMLNTGSPFGYTYTTSWSSLTGKFSWTVTGNGGSQPIFSFLNDQVNDLLGFSDDDQFQIFSADSLTSTRQINLNHTKYLQIRSNLVDNAGNESEYEADILARIPCSHQPYGSVIEYELKTFDAGIRKIKYNKSNVYSFTLQDDHDREISLNGFDWSFTISMMQIE